MTTVTYICGTLIEDFNLEQFTIEQCLEAAEVTQEELDRAIRMREQGLDAPQRLIAKVRDPYAIVQVVNEAEETITFVGSTKDFSLS